MKFWLLWGFDAVITLGFVYFFLLGIADGSVSSFNIVLWLGILGTLGAGLGGSFFLKLKGQGVLAVIVLCLLAIPALGSLLFFLMILITNPKMQ